MAHPAARFFAVHSGPYALAGGCKLCRHVDSVPKPHKPGKGWGWREGAKLRGRLIQHVKSAHADSLKEPTT